MWSQKNNICVQGLKELYKQPFKIDSDLFEAHPLHKLDEDDTSMDGKPSQMVVEPAILAWGNGNGESYDASRTIRASSGPKLWYGCLLVACMKTHRTVQLNQLGA